MSLKTEKVHLGRVGQWDRSEFYFDPKSNCFVEEKYQEEYLDTGTIYKGATPVSPLDIYVRFVQEQKFNSIYTLLECVKSEAWHIEPESEDIELAFLQQLDTIDPMLRTRLKVINNKYIFKNQYNKIIGVLFIHNPFCAYHGLQEPCKGFLSKQEAFTYAVECLRKIYVPCTVYINDKPTTVKRAPANNPSERGLLKYEDLETALVEAGPKL